MSYPRRAEPSEQLNVNISASVLADVRSRLQDPLTRRTRYGAMNELVESLLRHWLKEQQNEPAKP